MMITYRQIGRPVAACAGLLFLLVAVMTAGAAPPHQDGLISYGQTTHGNLTEAVSEETWRFAGQAGDLVLIDMWADDPDLLDTYLTLLDPRGGTLLTDDDGGDRLNSRIGPYRLAESGEYSIIASRYSGVGMYSLALRNLSAVPSITIDKPLVGVVNSQHANDYFLLAPGPDLANAMLRLEVRDDNAYSDPFLTLYGPNGIVVGTEMEETQAGIIDPFTPLPGEQYVVAVTWNAESPGGPYELMLTDSQVELLEPGQTVTGTLDYETFVQRHYFLGEAGQSVRITIRMQGNLSASVMVTSIDGQDMLFTNDGSTVRELTAYLDLPRSSLYRIEIRDGSFGGEDGTYEITIEGPAG